MFIVATRGLQWVFKCKSYKEVKDSIKLCKKYGFKFVGVYKICHNNPTFKKVLRKTK